MTSAPSLILHSSIFNLLLSISPFIYLAYFYLYIKKKTNKSIEWNLKKGLVCYGCKEDLRSFDDLIKESMKNGISFDEIKEEPMVCTSCSRDSKLDEINGKKITKYKLKYKKFLITGFNKFIWIWLATIVLSLILDGILTFTIEDNKIRVFFYIGQIMQAFYWFSFIEKWKLTTIKEEA